MGKNEKEMTRAEKSGRMMAKSLVEMVNLMYQNNTAYNFMIGLVDELSRERVHRENLKWKERMKNGK